MEEEIPARQEMERMLEIALVPRVGNMARWRMMDSCDKGWKEGEHWQNEKKKVKNSQGKDPRTFEGHSQGQDPRTFNGNSQENDPSTFEDRSHQARRWRIQKKRKEEKWRKRKKKKKKKKKKKRKKVKYRKRRWWKRCKEFIISLFMLRVRKGRKEKESKIPWESLGSGSSPFAAGAELAMCQCSSSRSEEKDVGDGEDAAGSVGKRRQMGGGDSTKVEAAKRRRLDWEEEGGKSCEVCTAQWIGLEHREKVFEKIKAKCDIFFGIDQRVRKEEMEEQFNTEAEEGRRFEADSARITNERAGSEDRKHTSGGVLVAVDSNLGAVVGAEEGAIGSIPGNEGRVAQV